MVTVDQSCDDVEATGSAKKCHTCMSKRARMMYLPCNHLTMCLDCSTIFLNRGRDQYHRFNRSVAGRPKCIICQQLPNGYLQIKYVDEITPNLQFGRGLVIGSLDPDDVAAQGTSGYCVQCWHNAPQMVFIHCGHCCLCLTCYGQKLLRDKGNIRDDPTFKPACPECGMAFSSVVRALN